MPEDNVQETPEQAESTESPRAPQAAPAPPRKRGVSGGAIIFLVIGVIAVVAGTFYSAEIKHILTMQPWDKSAPMAVIETATQALQNRDKEALLSVGPSLPVIDEDGVITAVKPGPQAQRNLPVESLSPSGSASEAILKYDYRPVKGFLNAFLQTEDGGWVSMTLKREKGVWQVTALGVEPGPPTE